MSFPRQETGFLFRERRNKAFCTSLYGESAGYPVLRFDKSPLPSRNLHVATELLVSENHLFERTSEDLARLLCRETDAFIMSLSPSDAQNRRFSRRSSVLISALFLRRHIVAFSFQFLVYAKKGLPVLLLFIRQIYRSYSLPHRDIICDW